MSCLLSSGLKRVAGSISPLFGTLAPRTLSCHVRSLMVCWKHHMERPEATWRRSEVKLSPALQLAPQGPGHVNEGVLNLLIHAHPSAGTTK